MSNPSNPLEVEEAHATLVAEYNEVMDNLGDVWVKVEAVRAAEPTDNLHDLLKELEDAVKSARDGGMLRSGANGHRRALKRYNELTGQG